MYEWKLSHGKVAVSGTSQTLHDVVDKLIHYAYGETVRDFYINGHDMNEEFGLWIANGKVVDDEGEEIVPMNKWYDLLTFHPRPTRSSAPQSYAILAEQDGKDSV